MQFSNHCFSCFVACDSILLKPSILYVWAINYSPQKFSNPLCCLLYYFNNIWLLQMMGNWNFRIFSTLTIWYVVSYTIQILSAFDIMNVNSVSFIIMVCLSMFENVRIQPFSFLKNVMQLKYVWKLKEKSR